MGWLHVELLSLRLERWCLTFANWYNEVGLKGA